MSQNDTLRIGVYSITTPTNKKYVGMTCVSFSSRWKSHIKELKNGRHKCKHLLFSARKHGIETLKFEVLESWDNKPSYEKAILAKEREWWLKLKKQGFVMLNNEPTGTGSVFKSDATKALISRKIKAKYRISLEEKIRLEKILSECFSSKEVLEKTGYTTQKLKTRGVIVPSFKKESKTQTERECSVCKESFHPGLQNRRKTCSQECMDKAFNRHHSYPSKETLREHRLQGKSLAEIAILYGCSRQTIWLLLKKHNLQEVKEIQ